MALAVLEEIEQNNFVELETLALVNGQTEHISHECGQVGLALLVSNDDDAVTSKLLLLHLILRLLWLLLRSLLVFTASSPDLKLSK